jgi:hypothetical protein
MLSYPNFGSVPRGTIVFFFVFVPRGTGCFLSKTLLSVVFARWEGVEVRFLLLVSGFSFCVF